MYDIIVLGGGPGGYMAAERAGSLGKSVLLVEASRLGGVCLNAGCIPTKTLLNAAKIYHTAGDSERIGVTAQGVEFSLANAMKWKKRVVDTLVKGVGAQMKRFGVDVVTGRGRLVGAGEIDVDGTRYEGRNIVLATGSHSAIPPIPGLGGAGERGDDGEPGDGGNPAVLTSTEMLDLQEMPESVAVIGGGYIGMEFAGFFHMLGVPVTVIEMLEEIIPMVERRMAAQLRKEMKGVTFKLGTKVIGIDGNTISIAGPDGEERVSAASTQLAWILTPQAYGSTKGCAPTFPASTPSET
jgi:dihydrolipoamide dehydrogenase